MKPKANQSPESVVREIKRKTRRKFHSDEKIRIILEGLKGEDSNKERFYIVLVLPRDTRSIHSKNGIHYRNDFFCDSTDRKNNITS